MNNQYLIVAEVSSLLNQLPQPRTCFLTDFLHLHVIRWLLLLHIPLRRHSLTREEGEESRERQRATNENL